MTELVITIATYCICAAYIFVVGIVIGLIMYIAFLLLGALWDGIKSILDW